VFQCNRDIRWAIDCGKLIVDPRPETFGAGYDETSIDLHLGPISTAQVWDADRLRRDNASSGNDAPELALGSIDFFPFAEQYLIRAPEESPDPAMRERQPVCRRGSQIIVKPGGFLLWMTKEKVGTPGKNPDFICFVEGKSTRARTGIQVHLTAPTIHAGWSGKVVLEIINVGPFHFVLQENDVIAQLTVCSISSAPDPTLKVGSSATQAQTHAGGAPKGRGRRRKK
jgi:dCTP deaminase